jgi:hypothetical protein
VGALGLVTAVGGAIMFERFSQAGLPAEQAVAVQPKTVLLAVGAEALVPLAVGMLLLLAIYWILAKTRWGISTNLFALFAGIGAVLYYLVVVSFSVKVSVLLSVVGVSVVGCGLWALLARLTQSLTARALILAVVTILLGGAIGLIRTADAPKVRGAVVVMGKPGKVVAGIYVAETSDQVFIGQVQLANSYSVEPKLGTGAIIALNRADISTLAFASNEGLPTALRQARLMAASLRVEPDGTLLAAALAKTRRKLQLATTGRPHKRAGNSTTAASSPITSKGEKPDEQLLPGEESSSAEQLSTTAADKLPPQEKLEHVETEAATRASAEEAPAQQTSIHSHPLIHSSGE